MKFAFRKVDVKKLVVLGAFLTTLPILYQNCGRGFELKDGVTLGQLGQLDQGSSQEPLSVDGKVLYSNNCSVCHGPLANSLKIGRSPEQITGALSTIPQMAAVKLTAAQIQAVSEALKPAPASTDPLTIAKKYFPSPETVRSGKRIFRLTRAQLDSTTKALLPQYYSTSIAATMAADPLQTNYEFANIINFNSSNFTPLANWIDQIVVKVKANSTGVINCAANNNSETCLRTQARAFILKAFRGDVSEAKITELSDFLVNGFKSVGINEASGDFVDVVLSSPQYLFRYEFATDANAVLVAPELLQMMTYTLADAPPDKLSFASSSAGTYVQTAVSKKSTFDKTIATAEAREKLVKFFRAWLEVKEPDEFNISKVEFPEFDSKMATAVVNETNQFLNYHLYKMAPKLKDITQSNQSFVSQTLASIYGLSGTYDGTKLVNLNPNERLGIFTQPAVIVSHSGPTTTRMVKRGVFFARKVMCMELGAPPPGVDITVPPGGAMTERAKIEALTNQPKCLGCHSVINPLGGFQEKIDTIGRARTLDNGLPIDVSAMFQNLDEGPLNSNDPIYTLQTFTNSMMFKQCFIRQMFRYYMGRAEEASDNPVLQQMFLAFVNGDEQDILKVLDVLSNSNRFSQR